MISLTRDGIHRDETEIIGGVDQHNAHLFLRDAEVTVSKRADGLREITLTVLTADDVIVG